MFCEVKELTQGRMTSECSGARLSWVSATAHMPSVALLIWLLNQGSSSYLAFGALNNWALSYLLT